MGRALALSFGGRFKFSAANSRTIVQIFEKSHAWETSTVLCINNKEQKYMYVYGEPNLGISSAIQLGVGKQKRLVFHLLDWFHVELLAYRFTHILEERVDDDEQQQHRMMMMMIAVCVEESQKGIELSCSKCIYIYLPILGFNRKMSSSKSTRLNESRNRRNKHLSLSTARLCASKTTCRLSNAHNHCTPNLPNSCSSIHTPPPAKNRPPLSRTRAQSDSSSWRRRWQRGGGGGAPVHVCLFVWARPRIR